MTAHPRLISLLGALLFGLAPGRTAASGPAPAPPAEPLPAPVAAELRVRDTSFFAGNPFHFYIRVTGVDQAPAPRLLPAADDSLQIRLVGGAASDSRGLLAYTYTYEALPLQAGLVTIPGSQIELGGQTLTTPPRTVTVAAPVPTEAMELSLRLSHPECFVGEPVTLSVTWITALSLNGVKAMDFRIPILGNPHFQVKPPLAALDASDPHAIGLPVSNQRVIARYADTTLDGQPAVEVRFELILLPVQPTSVNLLLPPATLLCSYAEPAKTKFQGTRYPSHFNNDFFDQDVTGLFQRLFVHAPPLAIRIHPLPTANRTASFSGIVGAFSLSATADPLVTPALSPVNLKLQANGYPFPHLLQLPAWNTHAALDHAFLVPDSSEPVRGQPAPEGGVEFRAAIRPRSVETKAIPSLEFAYFDPQSQSYAVVRTQEIPLTVTPSTPATVYDLEFADGSKLRNDVEPIPGGLTQNALGSPLLASQSPHIWTLQPWSWLLALGLPPLLYLLLRRLSRNYRKARSHPELARRQFAFSRFRQALRRLTRDSHPFAISQLLRNYFADRFDLHTHPGEAPDLLALARKAGVRPDAAQTLAGLIARTDLHTFARDRELPAPLEKRRLLELVREFERGAPLWLVAGSALLTLALSARAESPDGTLREASAFFDRANELALVQPEKAQGLYRLAASRFEALTTRHGIRNGLLYYNLGNTYLLAGDPGRAILNYLRAQQYIPTDPRLADALREARLRQVDNFPQAAPTRLRQALFFWHYHLGPKGRFCIVATAFAAIWLLLAVHLFRPIPRLWKPLSFLGAAILLAAASSLLHARADPRRTAVIVQPEILPRKGDAQVYDPAFTNPLHSGAEITVREQRRDWLRIQVQDGSEGWIPAAAAERVIP